MSRPFGGTTYTLVNTVFGSVAFRVTVRLRPKGSKRLFGDKGVDATMGAQKCGLKYGTRFPFAKLAE
jgi:hypothetical protein